MFATDTGGSVTTLMHFYHYDVRLLPRKPGIALKTITCSIRFVPNWDI